MATITEDYVSLETVKLLKEKGFECNYEKVIALEDIIEERFEGRTCVGEEVIPAGTFFTPEFGGEYETYDYSPNLFTASAPCPTQAMAMKWLREVHNIVIGVNVLNENNKSNTDYSNPDRWWYFWEFTDTKGVYKEELQPDALSNEYSTYEEAAEAAIKYCIENLI